VYMCLCAKLLFFFIEISDEMNNKSKIYEILKKKCSELCSIFLASYRKESKFVIKMMYAVMFL
jgi:hypothetical protein